MEALPRLHMVLPASHARRGRVDAPVAVDRHRYAYLAAGYRRPPVPASAARHESGRAPGAVRPRASRPDRVNKPSVNHRGAIDAALKRSRGFRSTITGRGNRPRG